MKIKLKRWINIMFILLAGISSLSAAEEKTILMLVTGAAKMENGKPTGLWLEEFAVPYQVFRKAGYHVEVTSPTGGATPIDPRSKPSPEQAEDWKSASERLLDTKPLTKVSPENLSAIFICGGHGVMFDLVDAPAVTKLIQQFIHQDKPIAAVCHGPAALVNVQLKNGTPLVKNKKMTAFSDAEERAVNLEKAVPFLLETKLNDLGATVLTKENFKVQTVRDGNLITGQNPASSEATAKLLLKALAEKNK